MGWLLQCSITGQVYHLVLCVFGGGGGGAIDPSHRPGARRWAPGYSAGALSRRPGIYPTRAHLLACFICQPNQNQQHLNPIPEIDCFDPTPACCCWRAALRVGVACSVLCPMACGAGSQTLGPNPNSNAPGTQTQPPPLTEHKPKPALCAEGCETRLCFDARHPPRDTGALSRSFVRGDSRSRTREFAHPAAPPLQVAGSRLLTNDQQRQDMNPDEPGISQTASRERTIKNAICNFVLFSSAKS
jgi:hypothetical protein